MTANTQTRITWRVLRPVNRDALCLQILKYEWTPTDGETIPNGRSYILILHPEPHWFEYQTFDIIPESTVEIDGLHMILSGLPRNQWPTPFDPRQVFADRMEELVKESIEAVMHLEPAVEFDAPST